MSGYVAENGNVQCRDDKSKRVTGPCELCNRVTRLVRDHCHRHGWIRGRICNPCNRIIGRHECGWIEYANPPERHRNYLDNCPDCQRERVEDEGYI